MNHQFRKWVLSRSLKQSVVRLTSKLFSNAQNSVQIPAEYYEKYEYGLPSNYFKITYDDIKVLKSFGNYSKAITLHEMLIHNAEVYLDKNSASTYVFIAEHMLQYIETLWLQKDLNKSIMQAETLLDLIYSKFKPVDPYLAKVEDKLASILVNVYTFKISNLRFSNDMKQSCDLFYLSNDFTGILNLLLETVQDKFKNKTPLQEHKFKAKIDEKISNLLLMKSIQIWSLAIEINMVDGNLQIDEMTKTLLSICDNHKLQIALEGYDKRVEYKLLQIFANFNISAYDTLLSDTSLAIENYNQKQHNEADQDNILILLKAYQIKLLKHKTSSEKATVEWDQISDKIKKYEKAHNPKHYSLYLKQQLSISNVLVDHTELSKLKKLFNEIGH